MHKVRVRYGSLAPHNLQVLTGFSLLEAQLVEDNGLHPYLIIAEAEGMRIAYDSRDGHTAHHGEVQQSTYYHSADCLFSRSCVANYQKEAWMVRHSHAIAPNYLCYDQRVRNLAFRGTKGLLRLLRFGNCHYRAFEPVETSGGNGKVVYLTRLWDPHAANVKSAEVAAQRERINTMRMALIHALKAEYGKRAVCGLRKDSFSLKVAPQLVVSKAISYKNHYIQQMKHASVCVSSLGLHDSNGWKFAEYIAAGRAIVTERPVYDVPFASDGTNYAIFDDVDECISSVDRFLCDTALRIEMQSANREYYAHHLRPDQLVRDSLSIAGAG